MSHEIPHALAQNLRLRAVEAERSLAHLLRSSADQIERCAVVNERMRCALEACRLAIREQRRDERPLIARRALALADRALDVTREVSP